MLRALKSHAKTSLLIAAMCLLPIAMGQDRTVKSEFFSVKEMLFGSSQVENYFEWIDSQGTIRIRDNGEICVDSKIVIDSHGNVLDTIALHAALVRIGGAGVL